MIIIPVVISAAAVITVIIPLLIIRSKIITEEESPRSRYYSQSSASCTFSSFSCNILLFRVVAVLICLFSFMCNNSNIRYGVLSCPIQCKILQFVGLCRAPQQDGLISPFQRSILSSCHIGRPLWPALQSHIVAPPPPCNAAIHITLPPLSV